MVGDGMGDINEDADERDEEGELFREKVGEAGERKVGDSMDDMDDASERDEEAERGS